MRYQIRSTPDGRFAILQCGHRVAHCRAYSPFGQLPYHIQCARFLRCQSHNRNVLQRTVRAEQRVEAIVRWFQIPNAFRRMGALLLDPNERTLHMAAQHRCPVGAARLLRNVRQDGVIGFRRRRDQRRTERGDSVGQDALGHRRHSVRNVRRVVREVEAEAT